jgi:hypothetical protein
LVVGLGLIGIALLPKGDNDSSAAADAADTTGTTTATASPTTTSTTTTATTTATSTSAPASPDEWQTVPVDDPDAGDAEVRYEVPPGWQLVPQFVVNATSSDDDDAYAVLRSGAMNTATACTTWPIAAGVYLDESTGPTVAQAIEYAKGLATVAFRKPLDEAPTVEVTSSRHIDGNGWIGREIVVQANLETPIDCDLHEGTVALLAIATEADPDRTIMIAAYSGTDSPDGTDEATLRKIVESVHVAS